VISKLEGRDKLQPKVIADKLNVVIDIMNELESSTEKPMIDETPEVGEDGLTEDGLTPEEAKKEDEDYTGEKQ